MPLKNGNTVAVERRVDLASLFCMIGRHGPAVALVVIAMVSVLAGLVIYRTVRGKRRKATAAAEAEAADGDGDGVSPAGAEGDASVMRQSTVESTDVNDEGSSDVKEDVDLIQSDLRIRHRRAAAEKTPAPRSPPERGIRAPDIEPTVADDTEKAAATHADRSPRSDTCTGAEPLPGDAADCHLCESGDAITGASEEFRDSCLMEPEPINAENQEQGEEVSAAECQEDEGVSLEEEEEDEEEEEEEDDDDDDEEEDVSEEMPRQEDNFQCASNDPVCFQQTSDMSENGDDGGLRYNKTTTGVGSDSEEPDLHIDGVPVPCVCPGKDEEFEREATDGVDFCSFSGNTRLSPEGESKNESEEAEEDRLDDHLNKLTAVKLDGGLSGTAGVAESADLSLDRQPPQKEDDTVPSVDEDANSTVLGPQMPSHETENQPENSGGGTDVVLAEESIDQVHYPRVQSCHEDQRSVQTIRNEAFDQVSAAADPDTAANVPSVIVEDIVCPHLQSICRDQQIDHVEDNEASGETREDSATDAAACNNTICTALSMSEELSRPDTHSSSQDQQRDQAKNDHEDFSEVTAGAAPVMIEVINPPLCQIYLPSFEQFALRDSGTSFAGVGEESGISSMAVSPDTGLDYDVIFENMALPGMDCDLMSEGQTGVQNNLFADDAATSVIEEDTAGMVFGPYPSHRSQPPRSERAAWTIYESAASSQDMFGHEIEDSYHRAMDQFAAQIADSVTSFAEKQSDTKVVVESKEKKKGGSVEMKGATKAEAEEKEEDHEKTEISIMEATMDHNEWIMDNNYQAFPWMNLSAASFAPDDTTTNQLPSEECQCSSAVADTTCTDTTEIPSTAEVKQNATLSLVDENVKSVVAVQPMPQNVAVTFSVHYFTQSPYQTVAVTGNQQELGTWKGFVPLEKASDGHWVTVVSLPAESLVEWKFVVVDKGEVCRWEECGNRLLDTGSGDELLVHKCWAGL